MRITNLLGGISGPYVQQLAWGYGCVDVDVSKARRLQEIEDFIHLQKKYGGRCLTETDREVFYRKVVAAGGTDRSPVTSIYEGKLTEWQFNNPGCIPRPFYVTYCESLICKLELKDFRVEIINRVCALDIDLLVEENRCDLALQGVAVKNLIDQGCDLRIGAEVSTEQCDLAISAAADAVNCDVDVPKLRTFINTL